MFELVHGVGGILDGVPNDGGMIKNFKVVATFSSFIAKEVNFAEIVRLQVTQAEGLVPAAGEGVNGNLAPNRVLQAVIREFRFKGADEIGTDGVGLVEGFESQTFLVGAVATDRGNVDHGVTEFNEAAAFNGNVQIGNVAEREIDKLLVLFFTQEADEALI